MKWRKVMKKVISVVIAILCLSLCLGLVGCGGGPEVVIFTTYEEEKVEYYQSKLQERFPEYTIKMQNMGTGELYSKLDAEKTGISCDIVTAVEITNLELLLSNNPELFYDLRDYDFTKYVENAKKHTENHTKYAIDCILDGALIVNKNVLANAGVEIPTSYEDLLNPCYDDLISMPNPNSSGTGYCFYSGVVAKMGETDAIEYFKTLVDRLHEQTSSGTAPLKSVIRGDVGIGVCMLWQAVNSANKNENLQVVIPDGKVPYTLYGMAVINGKETKPEVKAVFDYLYGELNQQCFEAFNGEKLYVDQGECQIANFPQGYSEFDMPFLYDFEYKQELLDKWGRW